MVSPHVSTYVRFPAKQDMFFKTKEFCDLESKMPEQMPFEFLRYLLFFSRYEGKSEMSVCTYVRNIKRSYLKRLAATLTQMVDYSIR